MGWSIGYDENWKRDVGYGVPAICDQPGCGGEIDRGLAYVCGGEPFGGDEGCGLFFCGLHLWHGQEGQVCARCRIGSEPFKPTADTDEWNQHKLTDPSWQEWRDEHPEEVAAMASSPSPQEAEAPTTQQGGK
jgi:hypothetical protein